MLSPLTARERIAIARILKVNHAGEYGAIRIYAGQRLIARYFHKELLPFLDEVFRHEMEHCQIFVAAMPARDSRPCRMMWAWGFGGYILGIATALMGYQAIMVCTAAVEGTVHMHLNDQIRFLASKDEPLRMLISDIRKQELEHLHYAETRLVPNGLYRPLEWLIRLSTEAVIWLSTQGDVSRMRRDIAD